MGARGTPYSGVIAGNTLESYFNSFFFNTSIAHAVFLLIENLQAL
jgi:hypothetical protein